MDYAEIHDTLYSWSTAQNPADLANKVLGSSQISHFMSNKETEEVSQKIQIFLKENAQQFVLFDLPALKGLEAIVCKFKNFGGGKKNALPLKNLKHLQMK